ncbi:MAG: response regulator [Acidobacteriota bacterium]
MPEPGLKLLIVDDEPAARVLLAAIFGQMGHEVRMAEDGFAALESIRERKPDVLLSDLNMPGMSGFELLSVVRRRLPTIYVIATSGAYSGENVPDGIVADAFYEKATSLMTLLSLMKGAKQTEGHGLRREGANAPVWIRAGEGQVGVSAGILSCAECLRSFPQDFISSKTARVTVHETACSFCGMPIHFAVVQELDPATSQPYLPKLAAALALVAQPEELLELPLAAIVSLATGGV